MLIVIAISILFIWPILGFTKPGHGKRSHHLVLIAPAHGGLCGVGSDLSSMERGELCRDRCTSLRLVDYTQDRGAAKPNAKTLCTGSVLKCGVW